MVCPIHLKLLSLFCPSCTERKAASEGKSWNVPFSLISMYDKERFKHVIHLPTGTLLLHFSLEHSFYHLVLTTHHPLAAIFLLVFELSLFILSNLSPPE